MNSLSKMKPICTILDKWRKIFGDSENKIKDLKFKRKTILIQRTWE